MEVKNKVCRGGRIFEINIKVFWLGGGGDKSTIL
jgi:hypothetical protein